MRHLAQLNVATLRHPIDDPRTADFADGLPIVNGAGEQSPGYVWRLQSDSRRRHRHPGLRRSADHRQPHGVGVARGAQGVRVPRHPPRLLPAPRRMVRRGILADGVVVGAGRSAPDHRRREATARLHRRVRFVAIRVHDGSEPSGAGDRASRRPTTAAIAELSSVSSTATYSPRVAGSVVVAEIDDVPVACGAYRMLDDTTAEIRRMYVAQSARGIEGWGGVRRRARSGRESRRGAATPAGNVAEAAGSAGAIRLPSNAPVGIEPTLAADSVFLEKTLTA